MLTTKAAPSHHRVVHALRALGKADGLLATVWSAVQSVALPTLRVVADKAFTEHPLLDAAGLMHALSAQGVRVEPGTAALLTVADGVEQGGKYFLSLPRFRRIILAHGVAIQGSAAHRRLVLLNQNNRFFSAMARLCASESLDTQALSERLGRLGLHPPRVLLDLLMAVRGHEARVSLFQIEQAISDGLIDLQNERAMQGIVVSRLVASWLTKKGDASFVANQLVANLQQVGIFLAPHHAGLLQAALGSRDSFGFALLCVDDVQRAIDQGVVALTFKDERLEIALVDPTGLLHRALNNSPYFRENVSDAARFARGLSWLMSWSETPMITRSEASELIAAHGCNGVVSLDQIKKILQSGALKITSSSTGWEVAVSVDSEHILFRKLSDRFGTDHCYSAAILVDVLPWGDAFILPPEADLLVRAYGVGDDEGFFAISLSQIQRALREGFLATCAVNGRIQLSLTPMAKA